MILETLIQIISASLAIALFGTLCVTFTFYARYKLDNRKKPAQASATTANAEWTMPTHVMAEQTMAKKRLRFNSSAATLKESVS